MAYDTRYSNHPGPSFTVNRTTWSALWSPTRRASQPWPNRGGSWQHGKRSALILKWKEQFWKRLRRLLLTVSICSGFLEIKLYFLGFFSCQMFYNSIYSCACILHNDINVKHNVSKCNERLLLCSPVKLNSSDLRFQWRCTWARSRGRQRPASSQMRSN